MDSMPTSTPRILDTAELSELAAGLAARPELWRPHVHAEPGRRHFHRLVAEAHATVWLISWMPGTDTGFHDHDGAAGAVCVVAGEVCEERLRLGGTPLRSAHRAGEVFSFGPHDIHRVSHQDGDPAVTIHAYSPELRRMGRYVEGPGGVLMREALDEDTELRPDETPTLQGAAA
jgi:predicted metal-dependent enzyme (double-stranded beta helix superfamily)